MSHTFAQLEIPQSNFSSFYSNKPAAKVIKAVILSYTPVPYIHSLKLPFRFNPTFFLFTPQPSKCFRQRRSAVQLPAAAPSSRAASCPPLVSCCHFNLAFSSIKTQPRVLFSLSHFHLTTTQSIQLASRAPSSARLVSRPLVMVACSLTAPPAPACPPPSPATPCNPAVSSLRPRPWPSSLLPRCRVPVLPPSVLPVLVSVSAPSSPP